MENLNAEQVKKALECCVKSECNECPLRDGRCANGEMGRLSLALINSQEQRIKELTEENEGLIQAGFDAAGYAVDKIREARADTVRKIADLLWQGESEKLNICMGGKYYDKQEFLDQIAKEMLEGENV